MTGIDKARETAEKLKKDAQERKDTDTKAMAATKHTLDMVRANPALAKMYQDNASAGSEELSGASPMLKVFAAGKTMDRLADGRKPQDGAFYYKPTQEEFSDIVCHFVAVSRGFYTKSMDAGNNEPKFNQLVGGVIINDEIPKPFVMWFNGKKWPALKEFGEKARVYTKSRKMPVPMFALTLHLTTRSEKNSVSESWLVDIEIMQNEDGTPTVVSDEKEFVFLNGKVQYFKDMFDKIIAAKGVEQEETPTRIASDTVGEDVPDKEPEGF